MNAKAESLRASLMLTRSAMPPCSAASFPCQWWAKNGNPQDIQPHTTIQLSR